MLDEINTMAPANENAHNYFHRIWDLENIIKNEDAFKHRLFQAFEESLDFKNIKLKKIKHKNNTLQIE